MPVMVYGWVMKERGQACGIEWLAAGQCQRFLFSNNRKQSILLDVKYVITLDSEHASFHAMLPGK